MEHPDQIRYRALKLVDAGQHNDAKAVFDRLIELSDHTGDYAWRAQSLLALGQYREALADCEIAMSRDETDPSAFVTAAFIRAASPIDELRNGSTAMHLITHAINRIDTPLNWRINSIMAAVHAECGDFVQAVRFANESLNDAPPGISARFRERIQQYQDGIPYRASVENNVSSLDIREIQCVVCGKPAIMRWPPRDPGRKPRCVDCCAYDKSEDAE